MANDTKGVNVYRVGVLANYGIEQAQHRWQPTMDYLSQHVADAKFEVIPLNFKQMSHELRSRQLSFIITNPGQYLELSHYVPLSWLATMRSRQHNGATFAIGSTIIVRADSPITEIEDLRDKNIVASDPQALGGYQATIGLLKRLGYRPEQFFKHVNFLGFPLEPLIYQVRDGTADAAIAPFCTLEDMIKKGLVNKADFRVVHPIKSTNIGCKLSTALYPNWSFAASDKVPHEVSKAVTKALFELSPDHQAAISADNQGWTAPISHLNVIKLFKELSTPTSPPTLFQSLLDWGERNKELGLAILFIILLSTVYHFWLQLKFKQKSDNLLAAERELKVKAVALERMQSAAILGELGAGLAHEMNQPIAAITQYTEGAMLQLSRQGHDNDEFYDILGKINAQSIRAGSVVHRIHSLLKKRQGEFSQVDLAALVSETLVLFRHELIKQQITTQIEISGSKREIYADGVGLSQLLANTVKNSIDALQERPMNRQIQVRLIYQEQQVIIHVFDNGSGLMGEAEQLLSTFTSTKETGLGLGLAICKDVARQHHGQLSLRNCNAVAKQLQLPWQEGCIVTLELPYSHTD